MIEKKKGKKKNDVLENAEVQEETIEEELLPEEESEVPETFRDSRFSKFKFKKMVVTPGRRELHLEVIKTFTNIHIDYVLDFVVDLDVFDWRIEEKKKAKQNYENQNQMDAFDDLKKKELEEYDRRIEALETERKERAAACPKISLEASVIDFARKANSTDLVFIIPSDFVAPLNEQFNFQDNYKMELRNNIKND